MPFQDRDDDAEGRGCCPRVATLPERWLRKVFLEEWGLKLLALAITAVLWLAVTGQKPSGDAASEWRATQLSAAGRF
jgi:hypothetical protein